ncbi:NADP-dependent methylenetetrahydromethanopterin/methylenetetrahydrofolate dehydrogenase [Granulibacter bethesdensis]|uniref:NADP-dependent methylenetetrahydromethanopterin/methylenetetrahydrofolate dehydrogenase n=1 Tax=Granulibacter bethesdensis TaxID=364410 RepID=UPI0003F20FBA|nr:NADP-dependent methylenetetrahydromethanopterin/methylenetetrahydrofolate dehydrogenase [Granulibacter bethesdensis]AHJ64411.1 Methylenetetrahydromethanopterin dehydrogenase (NADP+) [Granulibacter bethesdensis CGDNIH4]AHJ67032.1 Methylenetetrahydromethanopterin dehydrogenase (NADP+) [Granulibacter bethesdensis]APH58332.1 Methylenetetrahydromethanopterin dehydrogenase (NADP+) [Granulibacter bethesdensis]
MTAKLLYQFDTDWTPSVFDSVVAYDGGADHVIGHANVTPENVGALVDGAIFTRGPKEKRFTALWIGGGSMEAGEAVLSAVKKKFFGNFRVSVMLDSNGSNTTAAAGVALLAKAAPLKGKKAIVLAGTGPVGMRAAGLMALEGADVTITGRQKDRTEKAAAAISKRFGVEVKAVEAADAAAREAVIQGQQVVYAAGAIGFELLSEEAWKKTSSVELLADVNAQPPLGIGGVGVMDKGKEYEGGAGTVKGFGALGIGGLKLKLHRACIAQLFEKDDQVLDAEGIYALAKEMA